MRSSIFKLLCVIFLIVVIMSEPPEKKFKNEAVAKAQRILRNSVVVPETPISSELTSVGSSAMSGYYQTASGQWKKRPRSSTPVPVAAPVVASDFEEFPPVILADSASVSLSARAGYYQIANGQSRKIPTPRSTA